MQLADLLSEKVSLEIPFSSGALTVEFNPHAFTEPFIETMDERTLNETLCALLTGWSLMDGDAPVPLAPETLRSLPLVVKAKISDAIRDAAFPNLKTPS